jgi:hypothetical protein
MIVKVCRKIINIVDMLVDMETGSEKATCLMVARYNTPVIEARQIQYCNMIQRKVSALRFALGSRSCARRRKRSLEDGKADTLL